MAYQERKAIRWKICIPLALLVIAGSLPGTFILANADARVVKILFGFLVVCVGIEMLLRGRKPETVKKSGAALVVIGVLSGLLCGLYGVGALLGAYVSRVAEDSHEFKANICVVFLIENTLRIIFYTACGILKYPALIQAVKLAPFMLAGLIFGIVCGRKLPEETVKKAVIVMLIISGMALIFK